MSGVDGESWKERLAYWQVAAMERLAQALPERMGRAVFGLGAAAAFRFAGRARETLEANLAQVVGERPGSALLTAAVRESFHSYARYWYDSFRLPLVPGHDVDRRFRVDGLEHIDGALERGLGALLALPHMGNWDVAGHWLHLRGYNMTAVAERLRPPRLYDLFYRHRRSLGMGIVPLQETRKLGEELMGLLAKNHLIALVSDRDLRGKGVPVEMFGAVRRLPAGPALLSLLTGSPLLPCAMYDTPDGWSCVVGAPLEVDRTEDLRADVAALTRKLAVEFERAIAAAPTQWHMFQPAWAEEGERGERMWGAESGAARSPGEEGRPPEEGRA